MTTIHDTTSETVAAIGSTLRACARMGRQPYLEELQAMGDQLMQAARTIAALERMAHAKELLAEIEARARAARIQ